MGTYRVLEDVALADVALEIDGRDLDDVFATAARALAELTVEPDTLGTPVERHLALDAPDLELLLYDWLAELVFLKDRDHEVYPAADARVTPGPPARIEARLTGGRIDRQRTALRADPKAVTMHRFRLEPLPSGGWQAAVVIDV